jgi:RES domain-containing protein
VDRNLAAAVARIAPISVEGTFERHVSPTVRTLTGSTAGGRWGPPGAYSVLYLGRPTESVAAEAYRYLVDEVEGMRGDLVGPRNLLRCDVAVSDVVDLRNADALAVAGLDLDALMGPHPACQRIGQAAHQLGRHGIIAPAATGLGETLALFERHLPEAELPVLVATETWHELPPDPRPGVRARDRDLWG